MCALSDGTNCVRDTAKFAECWQILMKARSKFTIKVVTDSLSPWKTNFDVLPSQMGFERTFDLIPYRKCAKRWLPNTIGAAREVAPNIGADVDVILRFQESHACRNAASVLHLPIPERKNDPSAGKILQSSLAMHPGEENVCYMFKKPHSWGKKLGSAMFFSAQRPTA